MTPAAKRIRLENGDEGAGFPAERQAFAEDLLVAARQDAARARQLVQSGADAWYADEVGWTALHHAAAAGDAELVQFMLRNGAVWSMTDVLGLTAGDLAFSLNLADVYDIILQEGIRSEMLKAALEAANGDAGDEDMAEDGQRDAASDVATFLKTKLRFEGETGHERCVDADGNGVMMAWEGQIMRKTADLICSNRPTNDQDFAVLNVGFGLGLVDTELQRHAPKRHLIIEAHPDVLAHMRARGWFDKPGVEVFEGQWQDYLKQVESGEREGAVFDAIYWDTFSEHYKDLHAFFDVLPNIMRDETARFSFFHGLGATSRLLYDVYTAVAEMHLREIGLSTTWTDVPVQDGGEVTWQGITRKYWNVPSAYRLPVSSLDM